MINSEAAKKIYEMLLAFLDKCPTHTEITNAANNIAALVGVSPEVFEQTVNEAVCQYEENCSVRAYDAEVMTDGQYDPNAWVYRKYGGVKHDYFERYKLYLRRDRFEEDVINKIQTTSEKVLSFCADPNISRNAPKAERQKKGLVVGDVQSGKTANYLGLINVACDYGYKIIILLAGATNSLRMQTQKRVDAGVIGKSIKNGKIDFVGVGETGLKYFAVPLTDLSRDFVKSTRLSNLSTPEDYNKPIICVIKKNASVLSAFKDWLNLEQISDKSDSILIIDDESDYASVNTNKPEKDPTKINGHIRDIFNFFPISSYVGFTATPFANVFINPYDNNEYKDLFPSNFIIQLRSPNTYFGYEKVFTEPDEKRKHLVVLDEGETFFLPVLHKKDAEYNELPQSLKDAILNFAIANVIRTKRGHATKHRSMMINISWLNEVQTRIRDTVFEYIEQLKRIVSQDSLKSTEAFLRNAEMARLYEIYLTDKFYADIRTEISFDEIKTGLNDEVQAFETAIINSRIKGEERFDYDAYQETGARAILIGGFVLSRGLTLEGLMTSYYSRSASAYDTLLQMCRWFGYRPKYEDLCRIFLIESAVYEFEAVIEAVENLKEQFSRLAASGKTPEKFGIMVRECPETLEVRALMPTARNKTRNTVVVERRMNFSSVNTDTSKLYKDPKINLKNKAAIYAFFKKIANLGLTIPAEGRRFIRNVPAEHIADLLEKVIIPYENVKFNGSNISEYIKQSAIDEVWDVLIANGDKDNPTFELNGVKINAIQRRFDSRDQENIIRVSGKNNRLSEPSMFGVGLDEKQIIEAKEHAIRSNAAKPIEKQKASPEPVAQDFLSVDRPPLLIVFPIDLREYTINEVTNKRETDAKKEVIKSAFEGEFLWGLGVGFPGIEKATYITFRLNLVKRDEQLVESNNDDEEEDDGD